MTTEAYYTARDLMIKIHSLDAAIGSIETMTLNDMSGWVMEIRPNMSYPPESINHAGLLPKFLDLILAKLREEREELNRELEKL